jgi:hypothetical protein
MVPIDSHGADHNKPSPPPIIFPEQFPQSKRNQKMECVVDDMSEDVKIDFHLTSESLSLEFRPIWVITHTF